jgi:ABC-type nitrate/sulfonate/bicarbonate transport system permease component
VLDALWTLIASGQLWPELGTSMFRAFTGLALGSVVGVALGLAMATSRLADRVLGPLVATTYSLPKTALVPLFILWLGVGNAANIVTVFLACLLPVVVSTYHGVKAAPPVLVWSARALGTPQWRILRRVLLPAALPAILTGIRIALGFSFFLTISAEMVASRIGIGKLIFQFGESGAYSFMFAGIAAVVVVAFLADRALLYTIRSVLRWHEAVGNATP